MLVIVVSLGVYSYNITNNYNILVEKNNKITEEYSFAMDMLDGFMHNSDETRKEVKMIKQNPLGTI